MTWNETIDLHIPIAETDPATCITLNLLRRDDCEKVIAGTTLYLYELHNEKHWLLRQGHYKLRLWGGQAAQSPAEMQQCCTDGIPVYELAPYRDLGRVEKVDSLVLSN